MTTQQEQQIIKKAHTCSSICPSFDYLINEKISTDIACVVPNCDEIFSNSSALNLHLKKTHRIDQTRQNTDEILFTRAKSKSQKLLDNCECKYYCPVEKCKFYFGSQHSLPTFHSLKNHFIRMHGTKSYSCNKCNKNFAIKSEFQRHIENCGVLFKCPTCECPYASKPALLKHLRKKNHGSIEPEPIINKKKSTTNEEFRSKQIKIAPLPKTTNPIFVIQIDKEAFNMQRSLGCQTQFNESQSTACQTYYDPISLNFDQQNQQTSSTSTDINFQSQETQTLNAAFTEDEYINMILADISTQTNEYDCTNVVSSSSTTNNSDFRSCSIQTSEVNLNTTCTQTNLDQSQMGLISNLELANLDSDIYFNNELCSDNQTNYDTTGCQTNDYYFQTNTNNTASTQTQTIYTHYSNNQNYLDTTSNDSRYIDTITQTDWNLIEQNF